MLIGLKEAGSNLESGLSYMMLLKEQLVHRVCEQQYSDKDREEVEENVEEGYNSLPRLGICNQALELENNSPLSRKTGFLLG